ETLYVLDEPTVGLHPRDTHRLVDILHRLRENGNTVVVVEHDKDVIRASDRVIDIGPRAGEHGGQLMFEGPMSAFEKTATTVTADYLRRERQITMKTRQEQRKPTGWIEVKGARGNNLKYLDARFPLGVFCCVTGVSGSGKTTLVRDTLYAGYKRVA